MSETLAKNMKKYLMPELLLKIEIEAGLTQPRPLEEKQSIIDRLKKRLESDPTVESVRVDGVYESFALLSLQIKGEEGIRTLVWVPYSKALQVLKKRVSV